MKTIEKLKLSDKYTEELQETLIYLKIKTNKLDPKLKYTKNLKIIIDFMENYINILEK